MPTYSINLERDDNDTFLITSPDFPEVTTFSDFSGGIPLAFEMAGKAIEEAIASRISDNEDS